MNTTAKIGAFFLVVLLVLGVLVLKIEQLPIGKKAAGERFEVIFKDVAGLDDKSAVRIAGVRVGRVNGIRLLPDGRAVIGVLLTEDVELREGTRGEIKALGLLGDKFVDLSPGKPGAPILAEGTRIQGGGPAGLDELTNLASEIGRDVKELTAALRGSLGGEAGEARINRIVDNAGALAEELRKMVEANRRNLDVTTTNFAAFSSDIRETLKRIDRILEENQSGVKGTVTNLDEVTTKLQTTADNLNSITGKIDRGEGTVGKLINDPATVDSINDALKSVKGGVDELSKAIGASNKIGVDLGFRSEVGTRGQSGRGFFGAELQPEGKKRFYRIELGALEAGKRRYDTETTTVILPDGTPITTQKQVETYEDALVVNAQVGYRWNDTVLRAGLFESRGGGAVDQMLVNHKLKLTAEAWDFNRQNDLRAQLRIFGEWSLTKNIFVGAGVTDTLNPARRSLVFGGAIRWKDDDARSLLSLGLSSGIAK